MNDFIRRYGRYLLFLPIGALLTAIGFFVGEHRATLARTERLPDEIASQHPRITPPQSSSHDLQAALAPPSRSQAKKPSPRKSPPSRRTSAPHPGWGLPCC